MKKMIRIVSCVILSLIVLIMAVMIYSGYFRDRHQGKNGSIAPEHSSDTSHTASAGSPETGTEEKNIILDISSDFEFAYRCGTVEELKSHSDIIIKGTVMARRPWVNDEATIGTDYTVQVEECYRGEMKKGDTVTVSNLGGDILAREYFEKQDDPKAEEFREEMEKDPDNTYVRFRCDGAWLPEEGKTYFWFLEADTEQENRIYNPVNVYEGIYVIEGENVNRYMPDAAEIPGAADFENQMSLSDMEQRIIDGTENQFVDKNKYFPETICKK